MKHDDFDCSARPELASPLKLHHGVLSYNRFEEAHSSHSQSQHLLSTMHTYTQRISDVQTFTHPTKWQVESNVALEVLAQYFSPMKYGIRNNAALWWKKLDSSWDARPRNIENLLHWMDAHRKYGRWWCDVGTESIAIFSYLSLCTRNPGFDVAARNKKSNKVAHVRCVSEIPCFLCIWNRNMIRPSKKEILGNVQRAMIIQILSAANAVHSLNSRDCSLTLYERFEFHSKSICRL